MTCRQSTDRHGQTKTKQERGKTYRREERCFKVRVERAQGGCLTERQREFVPGKGSLGSLFQAEGVCSRQRDFVPDRGTLFQAEGPKTEKEREPTVKSFDLGIIRLKASDVERRVRGCE